MIKHNKGNSKLSLNPTQIIVLGFFITICIGSFLLCLPFASIEGVKISPTDAIFTATSAVCVTGLVTVTTAETWTVFGQIVIIMLIQIGGLGFMTIITSAFILARKRITLKERIVVQESLNQNSIQGVIRLVKHILFGTFIVEGIGALILAIRFSFDVGILKGLYWGFFHSISAFCNAGFDIIGNNSLIGYSGDIVINVVLMLLIILGGLGFIVWFDIIKVIRTTHGKNMAIKRKLQFLNLHSKFALTITAFLILSGFILFFLFEFENPETIKEVPLKTKFLTTFMQSVTVRTAGFDSINQGGLTYASKFLSVILMFIGGSPAGTAGGIKTVTIGVIVAAVISVIKGKNSTQCFRRNIPFVILQKSLTIFFVSLSVLVMTTMILTFTERGINMDFEFIDLLFETASALGTTGLTTGVTPHLSIVGKYVIAMAMFMGRIGPITIALALTKKQNDLNIQYAEEKVIVG